MGVSFYEMSFNSDQENFSLAGFITVVGEPRFWRDSREMPYNLQQKMYVSQRTVIAASTKIRYNKWWNIYKKEQGNADSHM